MKKTWEQMTEAEKVEDLRNDVVRIFSALREIASDVGDLRTMVSEVAKKLDSLFDSQPWRTVPVGISLRLTASAGITFRPSFPPPPLAEGQPNSLQDDIMDSALSRKAASRSPS